MAIEYKISMNKKNTKKILVHCNIPLADYTAYLSIKEDINSSVYVSQITGDIDLNNNTISFIIPYTTFTTEGVYFYDITIVSVSERYTLAKGQIDVKWVVMD